MLGFSWSTFFVESINFLILVWLLTRFLYQPITRAVAARERHIADELKRAADAQTKAEELTRRYESRLADWEGEKQKLREEFEASFAAERARKESDLRAALERDAQRMRATQAAEARQEQLRMWRRASSDAAKFGARLLSRFASAELERRMIDATIDDLRGLAEDGRSGLARGLNGKPVTISTRFPVSVRERDALEAALRNVIVMKNDVVFKEDEALVSGIRIDLGNAVIEANVGAELRWFAQAENDVSG